MSGELHWQTAKDYRSELADDLAALLSIQHDLQFAIRACELVLARTTASGDTVEDHFAEESIVRTSLWNAALIVYARCFATGVRSVRLTADIFDGPNARTSHEYFLEQRNKHVAHSVNRLEQCRVMLLVGDGIHAQKGIVGGGPYHVWRAQEEPSNVRVLKNLAEILAQQVAQQLPEKWEAVLAEARALNDAALAALPDMGVQLPVQPDEIAKPRPR